MSIGAHDVTLDCQGYSITGSGAGYAIINQGYLNVTVKNCVLDTHDYGVRGDAMSNPNTNFLVVNNTINNCNFGYGSQSSGNQGLRLINNTITSSGTASFYGEVNNNLDIIGNVMDGGVYGVILADSGNVAVTNVLIADNVIKNMGAMGFACDSAALVWCDFTSNVSVVNNLFNNTLNYAINPATNTNTDWNTTKTAGTNIVGGSYLGGNYYSDTTGTGFSDTCADVDADGICDSSLTIYGGGSGIVDYLPLTIPASAPPFNPNITGCMEINSSGSYVLVNDIVQNTSHPSTGDACIYVSAVDDIEIDGQGYTITMKDSSADNSGIYFDGTTGGSGVPNNSNVTIKNLNIVVENTTDWYDGIDVYGYDGVTIKNVNITFQTQNDYGVIGMYLDTFTNMLIDDVTILGGEWTLLLSQGNSAVDSNTVITNSYFESVTASGGSDNPVLYIEQTGGLTMYDNYFADYEGDGFQGDTNDDWSIYDNTFNFTVMPVSVTGTNIAFNNTLGGNYYVNPSGTGFSETCTNDGSGICTESYNVTSSIVDYLPLTNVPVCYPDWSCSSYGECTDYVESCLNVTDNNACGVPFTGNLTDYDRVCEPSIAERTQEAIDGIVYVMIVLIIVGLFLAMLQYYDAFSVYPQLKNIVYGILAIIGVIVLLILLSLL